jgi:hypothetical protein
MLKVERPYRSELICQIGINYNASSIKGVSGRVVEWEMGDIRVQTLPQRETTADVDDIEEPENFETAKSASQA